MISKVLTSFIQGIQAYPMEVEVDSSSGLPAFGIVGLPDAACRESQDRVRSAMRNSGFKFPKNKITVNLAPADVRKEGAAYDLPIAIGILAATEQIDCAGLDSCVFSGELALDGTLRSIKGILSRASDLAGKGKSFIFPILNLAEASCVEAVSLKPVATLLEAVAAIGADVKWKKVRCPSSKKNKESYDFRDVRGQLLARRGIEVAAAGGHNLIMIGPPGSGKTMLAKRIPSILDELTHEESIETSKIHSILGKIKPQEHLVRNPPFRSPHHGISDTAMIGGGSYPRPGEISLAHHGVLFLDELPEYRRNVLEALRQPLEDGGITITRAAAAIAYPAQFMFVAAMNPCPCGYFTDSRKECYCTPLQIKNYMNKISGPLLDRIDIQIEVEALGKEDFNRHWNAEDSTEIKRRVKLARIRQKTRFRNRPYCVNARLEGSEIETNCPLTDEAERYLKLALEELDFSGRAYHKVLKVALTISDLDGKDIVDLRHIQEAIQYRSLDRSNWYN